MMSTGLTFGSIGALSGLNQRLHHTGPILDPSDRGDRERHGADDDRPDFVEAGSIEPAVEFVIGPNAIPKRLI